MIYLYRMSLNVMMITIGTIRSDGMIEIFDCFIQIIIVTIGVVLATMINDVILGD